MQNTVWVASVGTKKKQQMCISAAYRELFKTAAASVSLAKTRIEENRVNGLICKEVSGKRNCLDVTVRWRTYRLSITVVRDVLRKGRAYYLKASVARFKLDQVVPIVGTLYLDRLGNAYHGPKNDVAIAQKKGEAVSYLALNAILTDAATDPELVTHSGN